MKKPSWLIFGRMRFRRQLVLTLTIGLVCLALLSSFAITSLTSQTVQAKLIEEGRRITENFATQSLLALLYNSAENAEEAATSTIGFPDVRAVAIYNQKHELLLIKGVKDLPPIDFEQAPNKLYLELETEKDWYFIAPVYTRQDDDAEEKSPFAVVVPEPELLGFVRVVVSKQTLKAMVGDILRGNFLVSIVLAAILLALLLGITRRLTIPLRNLASIMQRAEQGETSLRAPLRGPKDVVEMEVAFNTMMDVLETRERELKLAHDAALRLARIKSEFAANVSHELRTPLNAVLGMLELLHDMGLTSRQAEYVEIASNAGNALLTLINDILDFSRIDSGKLQIRAEDICLEDFLDEIINLLAGQAEHKDLDMGYLIASDIPAGVHADPARLRQILINLVGNAIKFTEKGEVGIEVKTAVDERAKQMLRFEVRDTGVGIPHRAHHIIFDAFSQADSSSTRQYGGNGLGLTICRQLVTLMGGKIGVESEPGKGSTFWFTLPLDKAVQLRLQSGFDHADLLAGLRVLIVDDSALSRSYLTHILGAWGCDCSTVANAHQALEALRAGTIRDGPFELVIVDQLMPGMKGDKLVSMIAEDPGLVEVKTILMTNEPEYAYREVQSASLVCCINKPVRKARLYNCLVESVSSSDREELRAPLVGTETAAGYAGRRILVVEDNRANQYVAVGMLERLGCKVDVASSGQEGLEAVMRGSYDLILMDCQMPQMDGYEATRRIRKLEAARSHILIIAMTAHAREGDREQCLEAGMDDYLAKPLRLENLREKLWYWLTTSGAWPSENVATDEEIISGFKTTDASISIDRKVLEDLRKNIANAFSPMIEAFIEDTPDYLQSLRTAVTEGDAQALADLAHTIKGSSKNFGINRLAAICGQLEDLGRSGSTAGADELLVELGSEYDAVKPVLLHEIRPEEEKPVNRGEAQARVLIVDDDRGLRLALCKVLEQDGYQIEEAANGAMAMAVCERQIPDLVLLDAVMPSMDGFTVCKRIRQLSEGGRIPILIITALDDEHSIERAFSCGATDYIPKPVHFPVLRKRIARLLQANLAEKKVIHLAYNDSLTGLANRTYLIERLEELIGRSHLADQMLAVLFLDLDRFKLINDTLGHDVGDMLLKATAERLKRSVRSNDLVARLGGDEFTVVLDSIRSSEVVAGVAEKICTALAKPFKLLGQDLFVTASIGIAVYPKDTTDIGTLMKYADLAMYCAKEQRDGYHFYEWGMEAKASARLILENELRRALDRRELVLYYQPQAELATGIITGVEALVRWQHPQRGLLPPFEFIPAAEETGLIIAVGEWVLREACTQIQTWLKQGYATLHIAVNITSKQLEQRNFVETVASILAETGLPPALLELELTESSLMEHTDEIMDTLNRLKDMGVKLAIDDFGTGYSSLGYLKNFPVESLKVDRSFVDDITDDPNSAAIVTGIIALARSLRLKVVAEGVETAEQETFLKEQGCDLIQGYYLSKPLLAGVLEERILGKDNRNFQLQKRYKVIR